MALKRNTFYRRVLPDVCIAFASEKGKQLFTDALSTGYMNCYFPLASQFRTQEEPAYCGLSSLVMVLNALAIDPGVVWKGVFRWYHEDMLDCCTALEEVKEKGVSIESLMCLAICNQLEGELKRVTDSSCITQFREEVKFATKRQDQAIIVSYGRKVLGQTGTGHFSPIGGYNLMEDMVLILDVARFKYPPYWVPLTELWKAMKTLDVESGLHRGYMLLHRADDKTMPSQPPLLFKLSQRLNALNTISSGLGKFLRGVKSFMLEKANEKTEGEILKVVLVKFLDESHKHAKIETDDNHPPNFLSLRITEEELRAQLPQQAEVVQQLIRAINETSLCKKIGQIFPKGVCCQQALFSTHENTTSSDVCTDENDCAICLHHFLTVFLLSFPINDVTCCHNSHDKGATQSAGHGPTKSVDGTYYSVIKKLIDEELGADTCSKCGCLKSDEKQRHELLLNEVTQLRRQFVALMNMEAP